MVMATGMAIVAAVAASFVALVFENPLEWKPTTEGVLVMVISGILSSAVGYSLYYWLVAARGATYASLVSATRPVVAVLLSAVVAGAAIEASTVVGLVVLVLCIVIMSGYLRQATAILRRSHASENEAGYDESQ
jgi:drug/metabolite transporter (DMT)-like permease